MDKDKNKIPVMSPYHDISSPFSVGEAGNFAEYIARIPGQFPDLMLGAFVLIRDIKSENNRQPEVIWLAGRVVELKSISPFNPQKESALYAEDDSLDPAAVLSEVAGPHFHQPMVARIRLDRQMAATGEKESRFISLPVQRPPSAQSSLRFPNLKPKDGDDSPSLQEILEIRESGVTLGYVGQGNSPFQKDDEFLEYKWDIGNLDNKHVFIVGESGSGKTVFLKNLAYELRKHNPQTRIIMTDVQGDIAQLLLPDLPDIILQPQHVWQHKVEREEPDKAIERLGDKGKIRLVIPCTNREESLHLAALKMLAEKNKHEIREIGLRLQDLSAPSDVEYLFRVTSEQVGILLDKMAEYCKSPIKENAKPRPATVEELWKNIKLKLKIAGREKILVGDTYFLPTTLEAASRALTSLAYYFDHHQPSMEMSAEQNPLDCLDFEGTTILYLDDLDHDERIMWEMQLVKWLYDHKQEQWNAFVFFDEAHQIIPAKPIGIGSRVTGTFERLRVNFERLAREGRKFGINLILSTQSPQDLHPIVPEQCPTKIVMKINPRNAVAATLDKELAGIAARFGHGQFWIQSPFNGTPDWVRVHGVAPPLPHMAMTPYWRKVVEAAQKLP